jgi:hypothetical protein
MRATEGRCHRGASMMAASVLASRLSPVGCPGMTASLSRHRAKPRAGGSGHGKARRRPGEEIAGPFAGSLRARSQDYSVGASPEFRLRAIEPPVHPRLAPDRRQARRRLRRRRINPATALWFQEASASARRAVPAAFPPALKQRSAGKGAGLARVFRPLQARTKFSRRQDRLSAGQPAPMPLYRLPPTEAQRASRQCPGSSVGRACD